MEIDSVANKILELLKSPSCNAETLHKFLLETMFTEPADSNPTVMVTTFYSILCDVFASNRTMFDKCPKKLSIALLRTLLDAPSGAVLAPSPMVGDNPTATTTTPLLRRDSSFEDLFPVSPGLASSNGSFSLAPIEAGENATSQSPFDDLRVKLYSNIALSYRVLRSTQCITEKLSQEDDDIQKSLTPQLNKLKQMITNVSAIRDRTLSVIRAEHANLTQQRKDLETKMQQLDNALNLQIAKKQECENKSNEAITRLTGQTSVIQRTIDTMQSSHLVLMTVRRSLQQYLGGHVITEVSQTAHDLFESLKQHCIEWNDQRKELAEDSTTVNKSTKIYNRIVTHLKYAKSVSSEVDSLHSKVNVEAEKHSFTVGGGGNSLTSYVTPYNALKLIANEIEKAFQEKMLQGKK